jgi:hypothetical protein
MGHQTYAGIVSEQVIGGASFVRIDVLECDGVPAFSKCFGPGSIYCITPVTEEVARLRAKSLRQAPLSVYDLPEEIRAKLRTPALAGPREFESFDPNQYEDEDD